MKTIIKVCDSATTFEEVEPGTIYTVAGAKDIVYVKTEIIEISKNKTKEVFNSVCLNNGAYRWTLVDTKIKVYEEVECR